MLIGAGHAFAIFMLEYILPNLPNHASVLILLATGTQLAQDLYTEETWDFG